MTTRFSLQQTRSRRAFTLVELLVATVVLLIILLMLVAMVNSTSTIWRTSAAKVEQFRSARTAFESISRQLSQATMNTYFDYAKGADNKPRRYIRQSDLRFLVASSKQIVPDAVSGDKPPKPGPGHAVFFHAPLGFSSTDQETINPNTNQYMYTEMDNLLNTWGYFIEYSSDYNYRPAFLNTSSTSYVSPPERYRYRLMEMMVPSDQVKTYWRTSSKNNSTYIGHEWFEDFLKLSASPSNSSQNTATTQFRPAHLLAENVIMLVIYPQLSAKDQKHVDAVGTGSQPLAPGYTYDSTYDPTKNGTVPLQPGQNLIDPHSQLPPVIQVTMIAMDETSASRLEATKGASGNDQSNPPTLLNNALTQQYFQTSDLLTPQTPPGNGPATTRYTQDLKNLQQDLIDPSKVGQRITFRTFTTSISLRAAKWSQD